MAEQKPNTNKRVSGVDSVRLTALDGGRMVQNAQRVKYGPRGSASRAKDRRVIRTKRAIHEALLDLMVDHEYDKISISAVARKADIDRKTFYLHYATIDDVLDEILRERAHEIVAGLQEETFIGEASAGLNGASADLSGFLTRLSVDLVFNFPVTKAMVQHVSTDMLLRKVEEMLTDALIEEMQGSWSQMGPYLVYAVTFFCSGIMAVYRRWLLTDSEIPLDNLADVTSMVAFTGVKGILGNAEAPRES